MIKRFPKRIVHFENRDEVEITADIQDAIAGSLNSKYDLHISREFTMGRAIKRLGETDLYIYAEKDGTVTDYAVLENKLKTIKRDFRLTKIKKVGEKDILMIISEHIVPETSNKMKVFHLIFQLNDKERKEAAVLASNFQRIQKLSRSFRRATDN